MSYTYEQRLNFTYDTGRAVPISEVVEAKKEKENLKGF